MADQVTEMIEHNKENSLADMWRTVLFRCGICDDAALRGLETVSHAVLLRHLLHLVAMDDSPLHNLLKDLRAGEPVCSIPVLDTDDCNMGGPPIGLDS